MYRPLKWLVLAAATTTLFGCTVITISERNILYHPQPAMQVAGTTLETLPIADATVLVSVRPRPGPVAVVYFGGNAENAATQLPALSAAFPHASIYLLHYRSFGGSGGKPSEKALQSDGLALFDYAVREHPQTIVIGRSLGSGIAIRVAALRPVASLVLVTPYNSMQELAQERLPYLPISWLMVDKYESWRYAPAIRAPTLVIAAEADQVVPSGSTARLFAGFGRGVARMITIPDTDHASITASQAYVNALRVAGLGVGPSRRSEGFGVDEAVRLHQATNWPGADI